MRVRVRFPSGVLFKLKAESVKLNALMPDLGPVFFKFITPENEKIIRTDC